MAFINHLWQLYLFFGVGRMVSVGVLTLARSVSVSNWFSRLRGRAMGITKIGDRLGSTLLPLLVQFVILTLGWRMAWGTLGAVGVFHVRHSRPDLSSAQAGKYGTAAGRRIACF